MDPIVSTACDRLAAGQPFVLATIIQHHGSAPRTIGTRMLITVEKEIVGTIGGGLLEAETIRAAARMNAQAPARFLNFDLTHEDAAAMEMICGGSVKVFLDYIVPDDQLRALFAAWQAELSRGRKAMLVSEIYGDETQIDHVDHSLLRWDNPGEENAASANNLHQALADITVNPAHIHILNREGRLVVMDPGCIAPALYIFGAGHVARPTAHLAAMAGFEVVVLDDRSDFANATRFPEAAAVRTLSSFATAFENLSVNTDTYIVIVTRGHLHDRIVLAQALKTPAVYIGMIGSRRKRDAIYDHLLNDGYNAADIARVHCPIGLAIGAETPEEIAVSIVAEMITVRRNCLKIN